MNCRGAQVDLSGQNRSLRRSEVVRRVRNVNGGDDLLRSSSPDGFVQRMATELNHQVLLVDGAGYGPSARRMSGDRSATPAASGHVIDPVR